MAKRCSRRRLALSLSIAAIVSLVIAGASAGHYVYGQGYVYKDSSHCTWGRAEISHGSGGGSTKVSVAGVKVIADRCVPWWIQAAKFYASGNARVRHELWKRVANGSWSRCRTTAWKHSTYPIGRNAFTGIVEAYSGWPYGPAWVDEIDYGRTPPCSTGTYGVTAYMQVLEGGTWRGDKLDGGQHYLQGHNADINDSGIVEIRDLSVLLIWYGKPVDSSARNSWRSDINGDGRVDIADLSILLSHWGERS